MKKSTEEFNTALVATIPRIRRFCYALTGSMADADDLLQATVERALKKQDLFEAGTELDRWLYRMCRNIWIDEMRSRKSKGDVVEFDEQLAPTTGGEGSMMSRLTLSEVRKAMATLSDTHREVLALIGMEGLTYKEAAETLELPIGTIMSRLARARAQLVQAMELDGGTA